MNKNIIKTKKKLTIIFTVIVSLVIIILWISFFSFKYYNELSIEKRVLNDLWIWIESWNIKIDRFIKFSSNFGKDIRKRDIFNDFEKKLNWKPWKRLDIWPLSYIIYKNDKIISYDIKEDVKEDFINELLDINNLNESFELDWYLVRKIKLWDKNIVIFKYLRYNISDYLSDILIFLLVTFIFSGLLYFIWNRFVYKTFIPVEENIKDMNNFIHNAGHELKTPISVIDSNIQYIKDIKKYDESLMDEMKDETRKLNSLIDSLIKLSNIWDLKVKKEKNNLNDIINEILHNYNSKIISKKIKTNIKVRKDIFIESNKNYLYILLSNLIWNAIKYNINNWKINISYKNWELIINDTWIWIDKNDLDKIFDRFYKADESRNTEGFWIWLSLVKKISDIYNWNIFVESNDSKWTKFIIRF